VIIELVATIMSSLLSSLDMASIPNVSKLSPHPNRGNYIFKALTYGGNDQYLDNNMRANWLLKAAVAGTDSEFSRSGHEPLLALQAAMFMIGYDVGSTY